MRPAAALAALLLLAGCLAPQSPPTSSASAATTTPPVLHPPCDKWTVTAPSGDAPPLAMYRGDPESVARNVSAALGDTGFDPYLVRTTYYAGYDEWHTDQGAIRVWPNELLAYDGRPWNEPHLRMQYETSRSLDAPERARIERALGGPLPQRVGNETVWGPSLRWGTSPYADANGTQPTTLDVVPPADLSAVGTLMLPATLRPLATERAACADPSARIAGTLDEGLAFVQDTLVRVLTVQFRGAGPEDPCAPASTLAFDAATGALVWEDGGAASFRCTGMLFRGGVATLPDGAPGSPLK